MRIANVNFLNSTIINQTNQKNGIKCLPKLKTYAVCFRGRDLLDLPETEVINKVRASIKPDNFWGQGTVAQVYRIQDSDYCVRIPHISIGTEEFEYSRELTPKDKVNHVVAKLGNGISIMKFFEGETPNDNKCNKLFRIQFQEKIADMPIKSYSDLLHQIANAIKNKMIFDFSGGNLVADTKNNKLTAIDFYEVAGNPRQAKPLTDMYSLITSYGSEANTGKKIFDKIVSAGLEEFKPDVIPCMDLGLFDFESLCFKRCHDNYTQNHEKVIQDIYLQVESLKKIKKAQINDKTLFNLLEQKRNLVEKMIKQIR